VAPVVVHRVGLPGLAEPPLAVQLEEVQAVLLGLEVLRQLEVLQAQSLERFLLSVLQLRVLAWLV
jgi:predicted DNA-binding transcriptional regulator YafY